MTINTNTISTAIRVAKEIFSQQTADELTTLKDHFGAAYNEVDAIAMIVGNLVLRIAGVERTIDARTISPLDVLSEHAARVYTERFGA